MKTYVCYPYFSWDQHCGSFRPDEFEASSIDEVCDKLQEIIDSDGDTLGADFFSLEVFDKDDTNTENDLLDWYYKVKMRDTYLCEELDKMFKELRKQLKRKIFKDE